MSRRFSQGKLQGAERKSVLQEVQKQAKAAALVAIKPDRRQRRRNPRSGKRVVVWVALELWNDGRREVLDWEIASSEEHTQWEKLQSATREQTIASYRLPELARQWVRTTSLWERTNRQLRRKFRQVGSFGSQIGAEVAMYLPIKRLHARWSKMQWWEVSCSLYLDFRNLNHQGRPPARYR